MTKLMIILGSVRPKRAGEAVAEWVRGAVAAHHHSFEVDFVDLRELAADAKGLFLLTAQDSKGEYWSDAQQVVSVTDIGISAKVYSDGVTLWANSISGLTPIADASVRVYSTSNQLIAFYLRVNPTTQPLFTEFHPALLKIRYD